MSDSVFVILPIGGSLSRNMSMLSISSSVVGVTTPGCSWKVTPPSPRERSVSIYHVAESVKSNTFFGAKTEQFHLRPLEDRKGLLTDYLLCIFSSHKFYLSIFQDLNLENLDLDARQQQHRIHRNTGFNTMEEFNTLVSLLVLVKSVAGNNTLLSARSDRLIRPKLKLALDDPYHSTA